MIPEGSRSLILPVSALIFRSEGLRVGVVRDGNKAELVPIILGKDFGNEVEVVSGIAENDLGDRQSAGLAGKRRHSAGGQVLRRPLRACATLMVVIDRGWDIPETEEVAVDAETLAAIDRGIKDADEGRTVSLDEVRKLIPQWISKFESQNQR